jgi:DNA-directed RNA polymerase specialized sigma24 family protein
MEESTVEKAGVKREWTLTQGSFRRLLDWLDEKSDSSGQRYLEMRRRLVSYFDRKNCHSPDDLADDTLNRVARRLEEEGEITTDAPAHYCYIVARFVLLEALRKQQHEKPLDDRPAAHLITNPAPAQDASEVQQDKERRWECFERCMGEITLEDRHLIINYYQGEQRAKIENRRALAVKLAVSVNAVSIRACRIRSKLETCVQKCLNNGQ